MRYDIDYESHHVNSFLNHYSCHSNHDIYFYTHDHIVRVYVVDRMVFKYMVHLVTNDVDDHGSFQFRDSDTR